jgi:phosphoribosylaminoimidazole (AIR) synthetase
LAPNKATAARKILTEEAEKKKKHPLNKKSTNERKLVKMQLLKPSWVSADGHALMSVDIHPDGTRFATGGQGTDSCGRVCIWNMKPVIDPKAAKDESVSKLLTQVQTRRFPLFQSTFNMFRKKIRPLGVKFSQKSGRLRSKSLLGKYYIFTKRLF